MHTYWDLSEVERANLSSDDVSRFIDAELMIKGVLRPPALDLLVETPVELPKGKFYRVNAGYTAALAFASEEAAHKFLALSPRVVTTDWEVGRQEFAKSLGDLAVTSVELPDEDAIIARKSELKQREAARTENERRRKEFTSQQKKVDDALKGVWEDWHECGAKKRAIANIKATYEKYLAIAGDATVANKFLATVFTLEDLKEAVEWGVPITVDESAPPLPADRIAIVEETPF